MVAPHLVEQLATAVYALSMVHQETQQLELGGTQFQSLVMKTHAVGGTIQHQVTHLHPLHGLFR